MTRAPPIARRGGEILILIGHGQLAIVPHTPASPNDGRHRRPSWPRCAVIDGACVRRRDVDPVPESGDRANAQSSGCVPCARWKSCLWAISDALLKDMFAQDA